MSKYVLGVRPLSAGYRSWLVESQPGDLFAVLTDGLVEVFDAERRELGFDWAKRVLGEAGLLAQLREAAAERFPELPVGGCHVRLPRRRMWIHGRGL